MPNQLATKLCRLFDGGYCDVNTFARLSGISPRSIEWLTKPGARQPDRDTEFRITRTLAGFMRKYPELYWDVAPPEKRGQIVEIETHHKDERTFELYNQEGDWMGTWTCPESEAELALQGLNRWLTEHGARKLKVMRGGDSVQSSRLPASRPVRVS